MANGYWNRVLRVDLTSGRTWVEEPGDEFFRKYLGGRAVVAHYLLTEVPRGIDAIDPEPRLGFATGVGTGATVPGSGRHSVGAKSPQSGGFGEGESGGFWGAELKRAGWDAIVVQGRANKPVYLWIEDDRVELRDASHLWGKITGEVESTLQAELGDARVRVAQIGPAGERLVRYACVVNDLNEMAGRSGLGAVMGSKLLKAIAVRGHKRAPVANPAGLQSVAKWVAETMDEQHYNFHHFGTGAALAGKQLEGHLIVRNFRDGQLAEYDRIDARAIASGPRVGMAGCYACSVRCKKRVRLEEPYRVDPKYGGPEYETIGAVGTDLAMVDLPTLCKANEVMNYLGLDTISTGGTIAWAMECFELGLLTEADTGGLKLAWGDGQVLLQLIDLIGRREGFGDLLAEGALRAARKIGRDTEKYVVHAKGLEAGMHDPRGMADQKTNFALSPTGADHTAAATYRTSIRNTVGVCMFLRYDEPKLLGIVNDVTGLNLGLTDLEAVAERGLTMVRLFNLREGLTRADDRLPWRFHQPLAMGPLSDHRIPEAEIAQMVTDYYVARGWDAETGVPTAETVDRLGVAEYAR